MVSACALYLDDVELTGQKQFVPDPSSALFQESDLVERTDAEGDLVVQCRAARHSILKRLDLMGCTAALTEQRFREWREDGICNQKKYLEAMEPDTAPEDDPTLVALHALSWVEWRRRVPGILRTLYDLDDRYANETDRRMKDYDQSWLWFDGLDSLISLRGIIDAADDVRTVALDVGPLIDGGWVDADDQICAGKIRIVSARGQPSGPTIVLAEGRSDIEVLKASLAAFHPDLTDFVTFLDHSEFKVDVGASYVVKFLKAFAAARVPANVVAVFDNDAAGLVAHRQALSLDLPDNMACIHLPDIELGLAYPTIGPQGRHATDINGKACGIELYLGRAALSSNGALRPVRWKSEVSDAWQGEVDGKVAVREKFLRAIAAGSVDVDRDYPEMVLVWQAILEAATRTTEAAQQQARRPPKW